MTDLTQHPIPQAHPVPSLVRRLVLLLTAWRLHRSAAAPERPNPKSGREPGEHNWKREIQTYRDRYMTLL